MDVRQMLEGVKSGRISIEEAEGQLKDLPYEDLGYVKLIITEVSALVLEKLYSVRESRMNIWSLFIRNWRNGMGKFWEPAPQKSSMNW